MGGSRAKSTGFFVHFILQREPFEGAPKVSKFKLSTLFGTLNALPYWGTCIEVETCVIVGFISVTSTWMQNVAIFTYTQECPVFAVYCKAACSVSEADLSVTNVKLGSSGSWV